MEMLIILFILAISEKNAEFKETLKSVLAFYRENRELLIMLAGTSNAAPPVSAEAETGGAEKISPEFGGDHMKILELFLQQNKS